VSQDELAIAIVSLGAWGAREGGYDSRLKPPHQTRAAMACSPHLEGL
jgi:hypothetical protein